MVGSGMFWKSGIATNVTSPTSSAWLGVGVGLG